MKKTSFAFVRSGHTSWGGDLKAVADIQKGLEAFGHETFLTYDPFDALRADSIFFLGTWHDRTPDFNLMRLMQREYGCIAFHGDPLVFADAAVGLFHFVANALVGAYKDGFSYCLEDLFERPHLVFYFNERRPLRTLLNHSFLKGASTVIANSPSEQKTLLRDAPGCNARVVYWSPGLAEEPTDAFLRFAGVEKGQYILQVGKLAMRKNQLATLLAAKDLDLPLVFIASGEGQPAYEKIFLESAARLRKAPTIVISESLLASKRNVRCLQTPDGKILPREFITSAFAHAGLHLHPAFSELPGYTYLESARFGIPTIATEWCSLKDYFTDFTTGQYTLDERVEYVLPYDIAAIKKLIEKKFGQKYPETPLHPIFNRTTIDVARDFLQEVNHG